MTSRRTGHKTTWTGGRRASRLRRHPQVRRHSRRHVVPPAGASEIREAAGVTAKDVAAAQRILDALGLNG